MNGLAGIGVALEKRMRIDFAHEKVRDGHKNISFNAGVYTNMRRRLNHKWRLLLIEI